MKFKNMTEIFTVYENQWVALTDDDKIIASADTLESVLEKASKKGYDTPLTAKIPDSKHEFVLCHL